MKPSCSAHLRYRRWLYRLAFAAVLVFIGISSATGQEQLIKLRVGLGDVSLNKLPFIAAYEAGIYKKMASMSNSSLPKALPMWRGAPELSFPKN